jgi:hypothetical protein
MLIIRYLSSRNFYLGGFPSRKLLATLLFMGLVAILLRMAWKNWALSIPVPLQNSSVSSVQKNALNGNYFETSIRYATNGQQRTADFRIWMPQGVQRVRGLIIKQHRCGDDPLSNLSLNNANDLQWQALALKHQFALVAAKRINFEFCDGNIDRNSDDIFLKALQNLALKSNHPELEKIPWALWGHSGGADWAVSTLLKYPERTIAVVALRSGGILISGASEVLASKIDPKVLGVPVLFSVGEKEQPEYFEEAHQLPKKVFSRYRKAGALWALAEEADGGHGSYDTRLLAIPYLDSILSTRLKGTDNKLYPINPDQGWLGNLTTHTANSIGQYNGDALAAAWLPNEEIAHKWQAYSTTPDFWNRMRYKLCASQRVANILGVPHLTDSCYPDKITPTRPPSSPTNARITKISGTELVLNWDFVPDLENRMPSFRIYRNKSLLATLQSQDYNSDDAPKAPQVVLEFKDKHPIFNASYTISAFNLLGESLSQPAY